MREIYTGFAREGTGMMDHTGPLWDGTDLLADWNGTTVAVGAGGVLGYATWDRTGGYDASGRIEVGNVIAVTADAATALLAMLGRWASVAPTLVFRQGGADPLPLLTALGVQGRVERRQPWMLRLVDVAGAVAARGWSPFLKGTVDIALRTPMPWNSGQYRLVLDGGEGRWEPGGSGRCGSPRAASPPGTPAPRARACCAGPACWTDRTTTMRSSRWRRPVPNPPSSTTSDPRIAPPKIAVIMMLPSPEARS
jgi:predicted acetyltransferase